ncbi:MAG: hypothetical protein WC713_00935 [Candidatus Methylomirabilota bacterium]
MMRNRHGRRDRARANRPALRSRASAVAAWLLTWVLLSAPALAADVLVLERSVSLRSTPHVSGRELATLRAGETYEIARRRLEKQPRYILDEQGTLWLRIQANEELAGFVQTDQISVAREEIRSPRGNPLLLVNIRTTADGETDRDLWLVGEGWQRTMRLASIEGRPVWAASGEWFICQVDSGRRVRDPLMERTLERIERFSADGRTRTLLAAGSQPTLHPGRHEVYFYRDVNAHGDPVPPALFAVSADGGPLRAVYPLPERYRFWKEDGDYFIQAPQPIVLPGTGRIVFFAYERGGFLTRFLVTLEGHPIEIRRE